MANNTSFTIKGEVKIDGLKEGTQEAKKLNAELSKIAKPVAAAKAPSKALAAAKEATELRDYGVTRSVRPGGTGASARDFAQEAQGLGGLVRLYATYAANLFAVSAAFNALSSAMDTTNMIKGLNQLGSASGVALGSLSRDLVRATDGAVSLREAMEATVKASSSGMSSKDILRMGEAAQKASLALGVNMSDALSRISRGITKLEPELLDELGIFVRVDDAVKEYAKSVGKSASELTNFERRAAFSNAVLEQAEKKFSAIDIESNPYTQLLATLKDFGQTVGEVLNIALVPLVKLLSSSPVALTTVIGGITALLLKQAIPAFGELRASMQASAEKAADIAAQKLNELKQFESDRLALVRKAAEDRADAEIGGIDKVEEKFNQLKAKNIFKDKSFAGEILSRTTWEGVESITKEELAKIDKAAKGLRTKGMEESAQAHESLASSIRSAQKAREDYIQVVQREEIALKKSVDASLVAKASMKAQQSAISSAISSNAAYTGSIHGITVAVRRMNQEIAANSLTGFTKFKTQVVGTFGAISGRIGTAISALSGWISAIGVAAAAVGILDMVFSTASKEIGEFSNSVEKASEVSRQFEKTVQRSLKDSTEGLFDVGSLKAYANALQEINDTAKSIGDSFFAARKKMGRWETSKDFILGIFNQDLADDMADSLTEMIGATLANVRTPEEAELLRSRLAAALNVSAAATLNEYNAAIERAGDSNNKVAIEAVAKAIASVTTNAQEAASKVEDFDTSLKTAKEAFKAFSDQYKVTDPTQKLGESIIANANTISQVLEDPKVALTQLFKISSDIEKISLFDPVDQANLVQYRDKLALLNKQQQEYTIAIEINKAKLKELQDQLAYQARTDIADRRQGPSKEFLAIGRQVEAQRAILVKSETALANVSKESKLIISSFDGIAGRSFKKGADLIAKSIEASAGSAAAEINKGLAAGLGGLSGAAELQAKAAKADLGSKASLIQVQLDLITATYKNTQATQLNTLAQELALSRSYSPEEATKRAAAGIRSPETISQEMSVIRQTLGGLGTKPGDAIRDIAEAAENGTPAVKAIASEFVGIVQQISGMRSELSKLGAQARIVDLDKASAKLGERNADAERLLNTQINSLDAQTATLKVQELKNRGLAEEDKRRLESLELEKEALAYQIEYNKANTVLQQQLIYVSEIERQKGKSSKEYLEASNSLALERGKIDSALANKRAQLEGKEAAVLAARYNRERELFEFKQATAKIQQETAFAAEEHSLEIMKYGLEEAEMRGQLSERELADYKLKILRTTEEFNLKKKLYELEVNYLTQVRELQDNASKYSLEEMRSRMQALAQSYSQSVDQAVESSAKKIGVESLKIEDAAYSNLKEGLTDAIVTALFEGGKEGSKKLRKTLEDELKKPLTVTIKGIVKDLVSLVTGGGGGNTLASLQSMYSAYTTGSMGGAGAGAGAVGGTGTAWSSYLGGSMSYSNAYGSTLANATGTGIDGLLATNSAYGTGGTSALGYMGYAALIAAAVLVAENLYDKGYNRAAVGKGGPETVRFGKSSYTTDPNISTSTAYANSIENLTRKMLDGIGMSEKWADILSGTTRMATLFGRKLSAYGYEATFTEGQLDVGGFARYKGGLFRSNKTIKTDIDSKDAENLRIQIELVQQSAKSMAEALGYSSASIDKYTGSIKVNMKNATTVEEQTKRLNEAMDSLQWNMLKAIPGMDMSREAFDKLKIKSIEFAEAMGFSASTLASTIRDGMLGRVTEAQLGEALAEQIIGSVYNALASGFADQISGAITNLIISPIMTSVLAGGTVSAAVSSVAIDTVLKTAKNAIDAFTQILNDPAVQSMFQQLAGMTKQLTGIIVQPVKNIKTFTSSMLANQNAALEKAKAIAQERFSLEGKLLDLLGNTAKIRERELATINASNRSLQKQIWALEDARKAVDDVFAKLERSIEKEKERVQTQLDLARETEEKARTVFDILKTNIEELLGISAAKMLQSEAKALIQTAITSGQLPDSDKLSEAISVLRDSLETTNYRNAVEERKASTKLANQLSTLQAVVQPQLTEAEQTIALLEGQLTSLDSQLEVAKSSLDALYGIDNSIGNVAELIKQLTDASSQYSIQRTISEALVASAPASVAATQASTSSGYTSSAASTAKQWTAAGYAAKNPDLVRYYNQNSKETWWPDNLNTLNAYLKWHWEGDGKKEKRKFKDGGKYPGGVALVGEEGPELINFENPGMVYTAAETRNLLSSSNNPDQERINKELLEQISLLRYEAQATAIHTGKLHKLLERLSRNGKSLLVTDVTTETV